MQLSMVIGGVIITIYLLRIFWHAARCPLGWHELEGAIRHRWVGTGPDKGKVGMEYECARCGQIFARTTLSASAHVRRQVGPQIQAAREASRVIKFRLIENDERKEEIG